MNEMVIFVAPVDWEIETNYDKCLLTFVEELDMLSQACGLRSLREGCIYLENSRRSSLISTGLYTCETAIQK
jgi:hypothetical protein